MQIKMLRQWGWRGGSLLKGELYTMPKEHCQVIIDEGAAEEVREVEVAMSAPPVENAAQRTNKPKGRPRGATVKR